MIYILMVCIGVTNTWGCHETQQYVFAAKEDCLNSLKELKVYRGAKDEGVNVVAYCGTSATIK